MAHAPARFSVLFPSLLAVAGVAACDGAPARAPTDVTTTSATIPSPASLPPSSHVVDAAGWVDPAGRTSDETNRSQFSGMRATEAGGQSTTGTPGSGLPLPIESNPKPSESERIQRQAPVTAGPPKGAPNEQVIGRVAEAWCDREQFCGKVGTGKTWKSGASCIDRHRPDVRASIENASCPNGFDSAALSNCLNGLRRAECSTSISRVDSINECNLGGLCLAAR